MKGWNAALALLLIVGGLYGQPRLRVRPLPFQLGVRAGLILDGGISGEIDGELLFDLGKTLFLRSDLIRLEVYEGGNSLSFNRGLGFDLGCGFPFTRYLRPYLYGGLGFQAFDGEIEYQLRAGLGVSYQSRTRTRWFGEGGVDYSGDRLRFKLMAGVRLG